MATPFLIKTADQLREEEITSAQLKQSIEQSIRAEQEFAGLVKHILSAWENAKNAKQTVARQMIESLRQRNGEYDPQKLAHIRQIGSAEVYVMLTNIKCRSAEAWIRDILFQSGQRPWDIEPTPEPELPQEVMQQIKLQFYEQAIARILLNASASGQRMDLPTLLEELNHVKEIFEKKFKKMIYDRALEEARKIASYIEDYFVEGGFYEALGEAIWYIVTLKAAFLKGPIPRKKKLRVPKLDPMTGLYTIMDEERIVLEYECVSPFDIFPAPYAIDLQDGDLIERTYYTPSQLDSFIGIPGMFDDEIRAVLREYEDGVLNDWLLNTDIEQERMEQEQQIKDHLSTKPGKIPCLIWWGSASGKKFIELGIKEDRAGVPLEEDRIYHGVAWLIGKHIIKAMLNPDPNGERPYYKASYEQFPYAFWGRSIPEILKDIQTICNACARALVMNIAIASGPQVEIIKDRFPPDYDFRMWGWKSWISDEEVGSNRPALTFYQPPMVTDQLINVLMTFFRIADDFSIPSYAHGDPRVGGAGNTASGLSMLLTGSARGIKDVIRNIDLYLIRPAVEKQFYWFLSNYPQKVIMGDLKVVAKGSSHLSIKQEQAMRMLEFARNLGNPIDLQIQGLEGRKYLLRSAAQALNIDPEKAFPDQNEVLQPMSQPMSQLMSQLGPLPPANNYPAPQTLDVAGNPAQGVEVRRFNEGER